MWVRPILVCLWAGAGVFLQGIWGGGRVYMNAPGACGDYAVLANVKTEWACGEEV